MPDDKLAPRLARHLPTSPDNPALAECLGEARALVEQRVGTHEVPAAILDRAVVEVAADLYHRAKTANGVAEFADDGSMGIRISRDPMLTAYKVLEPWLPGGFA